ncbi:MAG: JAB domain-containing protein [Eubacteriales bacterium]|nr:JAB domain-containing protein [Eubacteriales bacterium]
MSEEHAGHRERLRARAARGGIAAFHPHEVLEILLMQIIPVRDVNPLGHKLINRFGSVEAVLTAPVEELVQVEGVGERSAQWLRAAGELALSYAESWTAPQSVIKNVQDAIRFLQRGAGLSVGDFALICLDHSGRVLHCARLSPERSDLPHAKEMVRCALSFHAAQTLSVRVAADMRISPEEKDFVRRMERAFAVMEIAYLDHIIASGESFFSARKEEMIRLRFADRSVAAEEQ